MDTSVYRVRVVKQFEMWYSTGKNWPLAISAIEGASWLTLSSHVVDYIPVIQQQERSTIRKAVEGQDVSVFFDGSSHLRETLAIAVQFLSGWSIQQRIVRLSVLATSFSSENLGREVLMSFSTELGVTGNCLLVSTHDHASVNTAAKRAMSIMYPSVMDIWCFSHMLNNVGQNLSSQPSIRSWSTGRPCSSTATKQSYFMPDSS